MLLITAPSKTQQQLTHRCSHYTLPQFLAQATELNTLLAALSPDTVGKLMNTSTKLTSSTLDKICNFQPPPTPDNSCQALFTFQGDAYSSLTPLKYSEDELVYAQHHVRILSGLYGILKPLDLMFPYRLEMATNLENNAGTNLYQFWRALITPAINQELATQADQTLINLASVEYSKVIDPKALTARMVTITFKEEKGGKLKTIPIHSKRARGMMIHHAITNRLANSEELKDFCTEGYHFSAQLSREDH